MRKFEFTYAHPPSKRAVPHLLEPDTGRTMCGRTPSSRWRQETAFEVAPQPSTCYICFQTWHRRERVDAWSHRYEEPPSSQVAW